MKHCRCLQGTVEQPTAILPCESSPDLSTGTYDRVRWVFL